MSNVTIYSINKPIFLCDEITPTINEYRHHPDAVYIDEVSNAAINSLLTEINKPQFHAGIMYDKDFTKLKTAFFKHFTLIKAAGGLVKNKEGKILLIFRLGKWDLPKGKLDDNESLEECAIREVQEETGLQKLEIRNLIKVSYHIYTQFGKHILKETHWYAMNATENEKLTPQTEEDITEIIWATKADLNKYISNSYPNVIALLETV